MINRNFMLSWVEREKFYNLGAGFRPLYYIDKSMILHFQKQWFFKTVSLSSYELSLSRLIFEKFQCSPIFSEKQQHAVQAQASETESFLIIFGWFDSYCLFGMSGQVFLSWTSTKQQIKCLAQRHSDSTGGEARTSNLLIPSLSNWATVLPFVLPH